MHVFYYLTDSLTEEVTTVEPTTTTTTSTTTTVSTTTTISTTSTTEKVDVNSNPNGLNADSLGEKTFTPHIIDDTLPDPSNLGGPELYKAGELPRPRFVFIGALEGENDLFSLSKL